MQVIPKALHFANLIELKNFVAGDPFKDLGTYALLYKVTGDVDGPYELELCGEVCRTFEELDWEFDKVSDVMQFATIRTLRKRLDLIVEFGVDFSVYATFENGKDIRGYSFDRRTWVPPTPKEIALGILALKEHFADAKKKPGSKAS